MLFLLDLSETYVLCRCRILKRVPDSAIWLLRFPAAGETRLQACEHPCQSIHHENSSVLHISFVIFTAMLMRTGMNSLTVHMFLEMWQKNICRFLYNCLPPKMALLFILQACLIIFFVIVWYLFYSPFFLFLSILLWKLLWFNEVLTLFCLFLIMRMEISYERYYLQTHYRELMVSGGSLQLVTATHGEGSGLILHEWHSQGYDHIHSHLGFSGSDMTVISFILCGEVFSAIS
jgi:hypothetical protein